MKLKKYMKTVRISNYIKNLIILFPIIFSGEIFNDNELDFFYILIVIVSFSLLTSCVYIMNDLFDKSKDKEHPTKSSRPIASGLISNKEIQILIVLLISAQIFLILIFKISQIILSYFFLYILNNIFYNLRIKKTNIYLASVSVSLGFYLRLLIGSDLTNIRLSIWLPLFVLQTSFFISYLKKIFDRDYDSQSLIPIVNKKLTYSMMSIIFITYIFYLDVNTNDLYSIALFINIILFLFSMILVYKFFISSEEPKDPIKLFGINKETLIFIFWLFSFFYLKNYI